MENSTRADGEELTHPFWFSRIETLGTTLVVLMISAMVLWLESTRRDLPLALALAAGLVTYVGALIALARRSDPRRIDWWPFAAAGLAAGGVAELFNAEFLLTHEFIAALATGAVIGTAQWLALRVWLGRGLPPG
jgi:multisubunit Na+/H+ antiporter MnhB subunit